VHNAYSQKGEFNMEDIQIILSALWIATMLTYLLGDVLQIFSGDFKAGEMGSSGGMKMTQPMMFDCGLDGDPDRYGRPDLILGYL
jgi:hypothetical protein